MTEKPSHVVFADRKLEREFGRVWQRGLPLFLNRQKATLIGDQDENIDRVLDP
jgi:hypothetical protein